MDRLELATALHRAADYIDARGLRSGGFGKPGRPVCVNSAIAIGLGIDPGALGWGPFFRLRMGDRAERVAAVVLESGLLDLLPPPRAEPWERRRERPAVLSARQALVEVARWTDAPGRTAEQAVRALRRAAFDVQDVGARRASPVLRAAA
jgi:hypothetical protein